MKKFSLALIALFLSQTAVNAEEINLLSNAYNHPAENYYGVNSYFYKIWTAYNGNGVKLAADYSPNSFFSRTFLYESGVYYYLNNNAEGFAIHLPGVYGDFPEDAELLFMTYDRANMCYTIELNGTVNGPCTISGYVYGYAEGSQTGNYAGLLTQIVFVANTDPTVPIKSMAVDTSTGTPYIKVVNKNDVELPSAYQHPDSGTRLLSKTMNLTPEHKYLSIFAPNGKVWIANLQLVGWDMYTGIEEPVSDEETAEEVYYDLSGRRAGTSTNKPSPGLYLLKKGSQTTKTLIR